MIELIKYSQHVGRTWRASVASVPDYHIPRGYVVGYIISPEKSPASPPRLASNGGGVGATVRRRLGKFLEEFPIPKYHPQDEQCRCRTCGSIHSYNEGCSDD